MPTLQNYFADHPDTLIDELIKIIFPQNMKSMEAYYRWVSRLFAQSFGRLHERLTDAIFRYNRRSWKGLYLGTLAGTKGSQSDHNSSRIGFRAAWPDPGCQHDS